MKRVAAILVMIVISLHFGFMVLEMFYWDHDFGRRVFSLSTAFSAASKTLAANQGLYNGLLASGLCFAFFRANREMLLFLLGSVVLAGIYGGFTVKPSIYFIQALPGGLAFAAIFMTGKSFN
jgi:putative membrane protein